MDRYASFSKWVFSRMKFNPDLHLLNAPLSGVRGVGFPDWKYSRSSGAPSVEQARQPALGGQTLHKSEKMRDKNE